MLVRPHDLELGKSQFCSRACLGISRRTQGGLSGTSEYNAWQSMRSRCYDPGNASYGWYGGRGIHVCDEWMDDFARFLSDVGPKPGPKHTLDRIDTNGDYTPANTRWADWTQQARNRKGNTLVTYNGETRNLTEWAELLNISYPTLLYRHQMGWPVEHLFDTPRRGGKFTPRKRT